MLLEPLKQWYCDECGQVIKSPEEGWIEWRQDKNKKLFAFRIVHNRLASPLKPQRNCNHKPDEESSILDSHLDAFLEVAQIELLNILDPAISGIDKIKDFHNFVDVFRRLTLAYYEEARLYWEAATADGYFSGENETFAYSPYTLKRLIEQYGEMD